MASNSQDGGMANTRSRDWQQMLHAGASRRTMIKAAAGGVGASVATGLAHGWGTNVAAAQESAVTGTGAGSTGRWSPS